MCQHQSLHGNFISEFSGVNECSSWQFLKCVTRGGHRRGSSEEVIGGGHRRQWGHRRGSLEGSPEEVTGGGHQRGSPEAITGGGHRRGSSEAVIGGGHRRGSPEGVTGGGHRRGSLKASIESYLLHVEFQSYMSSNKVPQSPILS